MSIDALRPRDAIRQDPGQGDSQPPVTGDHEPKSPDFSTSIFHAVHLPTGLVSSPRPTVATVAKDLADLKANVARVAADAKSPEVLGVLKADARVYRAFVSFNLSFLPLAMSLSDPAKLIPGSVAAIVTLAKFLPSAIDELKSTHHAACLANGKAHPALARLIHDLVAMQGSAIKLVADAKKASGAP